MGRNSTSWAGMFATHEAIGANPSFNTQKSAICGAPACKKYPICRLYVIEDRQYVTVADIRKFIVRRASITVVDSKTEADLTRSELMQSIVGGDVGPEQHNLSGAPGTRSKERPGYSRSELLAMMHRATDQNMRFWNKTTRTSQSANKD